MQIKLVINDPNEDDLIVASLDSSSTISSWLIDYYFTKIYSKQIRNSNKSIQPMNIIGLHDMFIIYQILHSSSTNDFFQLCKNKIAKNVDDCIVENYNNYLQRCGLIDMVDLFHQCQLKTSIEMFNIKIENVKNEIDRLFFNHLLDIALEHSVYVEELQTTCVETKETILKLFDHEKTPIEPTISRNYIKHTLCTYLLLLLDTRNEHALVHCLATPARSGIERRTIIELRRLTKLSKNESLTIYQILLSFIRRKELILSRVTSSQQESNNHDDESFMILDKYYVGIKEFFDFIELLQMTIEENEHIRVESIVTLRKLMSLICKQLRKDSSFSRCDSMMKEIVEEFCLCFQTTIPLMDCTSPIRSASSGGTLAGRRFLRSVAYLCGKQIIDLPIIVSNNDHYDSPSTGLRKATSSRLLKSPITPIPIVIEQVIVEEKVVEIPVESVFVWQKKGDVEEPKRFRRKKSQRCLDLSTIDEQSVDSTEKLSSQSSSTRQPLGEIDIDSLNSDDRQSIVNESNEKTCNSLSFSLATEDAKENLSITNKKRPMASSNPEPARKKPKKTIVKPLITGQKMITNFFQSKT